MTQDTFPHTTSGKIIEASKIIGALGSIIGVLILFFGYVFVARDWIEKQDQESLRLDKIAQAYDGLSVRIDELTVAQTSQAENIAQLARNVDVATRPRVVFEVDMEHSGPREDVCAEFQSCIIDVRMRRTPDGLTCDIVEGSDRYYFVSDTGQRVEVTKLSGTPLTNIQREWFNYSWTFETPGDLMSPAGFMYQFTYTQCRNPEDVAEIVQESPVMPVRLHMDEATDSFPPEADQDGEMPEAPEQAIPSIGDETLNPTVTLEAD